MDSECGCAQLPFAGRESSPLFLVRNVSVAVGCQRAYERSEWADAIVVVHAGEIELECLGGTCSRFATGALLCLDSLPLRTLRNAGREPAVLIAVSRRRGGPPSLAAARRTALEHPLHGA